MVLYLWLELRATGVPRMAGFSRGGRSHTGSEGGGRGISLPEDTPMRWAHKLSPLEYMSFYLQDSNSSDN